jgi:16S rRNA (adenine1518-N6/adenine1519-N6)-dimethyltransferase
VPSSAHRPRKRFGQHFLHDSGAIDRMLRAIAPRATETIVEIGPGLGALTRPLLEKVGRLDVVEIDRDLIPRLEQACAGIGTLELHQADALDFDFRRLAQGKSSLRVVGNLPYNISTPLIFHLLEQAEWIRDMHFMLQKEVVARLAARPGGKDYGRLSVMVQYRCAVESLFEVGPEAFSPPPKVDSAVVRMLPYSSLPHPACEPLLLEQVVQLSFAQRRKTLRNTLKPLLSAERIERAGIDPGRRPETLSVAEFVALADAAHATE